MPLHPPPDVLASGDAKLFAVRGAEGELLVSSAKVRRFDADIWRRRLGLDGTTAWPRLGAAAGGRLTCDPLGCLYRAKGQVVALARDGRALADDCAVASVVVSREPVRGRCKGPGLVIDRFDLWRNGGHALWLSPEGGARRDRARAPWRASLGAAPGRPLGGWARGQGAPEPASTAERPSG